MPNILISAYAGADQRGVVNVILPIQRQEFGIAITEADQPDLEQLSQHTPIDDVAQTVREELAGE